MGEVAVSVLDQQRQLESERGLEELQGGLGILVDDGGAEGGVRGHWRPPLRYGAIFNAYRNHIVNRRSAKVDDVGVCVNSSSRRRWPLGGLSGPAHSRCGRRNERGGTAG